MPGALSGASAIHGSQIIADAPDKAPGINDPLLHVDMNSLVP